MGWVPDQRDFTFTAPQEIFKTLPPSNDLRKLCPPVYNQECLGSCTANAIAGASSLNK
jgi:hypothetical protein